MDAMTSSCMTALHGCQCDGCNDIKLMPLQLYACCLKCDCCIICGVLGCHAKQEHVLGKQAYTEALLMMLGHTSGDQGPLMSSGLSTFCHLCKHWTSVRSSKCSAAGKNSLIEY